MHGSPEARNHFHKMKRGRELVAKSEIGAQALEGQSTGPQEVLQNSNTREEHMFSYLSKSSGSPRRLLKAGRDFKAHR